jgi:signal transduction histidine kinase
MEIKLKEEKYTQLFNLTSKISHEILNPINLVIGFADVTKDLIDEIEKTDSNEAKSEIFNQIKKDQKKILEHGRFIFNLIHKMNFDVGHDNFPYLNDNLRQNEQEINVLCTEFEQIAYRNFLNRFADFKCEFENHPDPGNPKYKISITDFGESILNIFYNAFEATMEKMKIHSDFKPKIILEISSTDKMIEIRVADNGIGIPFENTDKIFNPFFTTKKMHGNLGLGLTASFGLIRKNKGTISLEKSDEMGSAFRIVFPLN